MVWNIRSFDPDRMENTTTKRNVVSLIRVSTDQQKDKSGPEVQRRDVRFSCKELGLAVIHEVTLDGVTGVMVSQTTQYREIEVILARPDVAGLVIPAVDRLTRTSDIAVLASLIKPLIAVFQGKNTKRLFVDGKELDMTNPEHQRILYELAYEAERERKKIRHRTMEARDDVRRKADALIDKPPYGVIHTRHIPKGQSGSTNSGTFSYDPEVKARMSEAFHRVLAGETLKSLFSELGFKSPSALRDTLKSKYWIGWKYKTKSCTEHVWDEHRQKFLHRKEKELTGDDRIEVRIPELADDPAVSEEVFYAVQEILKKNTTTWAQIGSRSDEFLGTNLLYCKCGRKLYHKIHSRGALYYSCSYKARVKGTRQGDPCNEPMFRSKLIDDEIAFNAVVHLTDPDFVDAALKVTMDTSSVEAKRKAWERAEKTVFDIDKRRKNAEQGGETFGWTDERIARVKTLMVELTQAKLKASQLHAELNATLTDNDRHKMAELLRSEFAGFAMMAVPEQKELLARYIERIDVVRDEFAGIIVNFKVKVGFPAFVDQMEITQPKERIRKPGKLVLIEPIRVKTGGTIGGVPAASGHGSKLKIAS